MENIFLLVIVAVVGLVQLAMRVAEARKNTQAKKQSAPPRTNAPIPRAAVDNEEERVRKFFEALGVPATSTPLPRVQPRQIAPKRPRPAGKIMPVDPFPVPRASRSFPPVVIDVPSALPSASAPQPTREPSALADPVAPKTRPQRAAAEFEVRDIDESVVEDLAPSTSMRKPDRRPDASEFQRIDIVARLATARGLRDAMILREVFGPPRSMQPLDLR